MTTPDMAGSLDRWSLDWRQLQRLVTALLHGAQWDRQRAEAVARERAADALRSAALAVAAKHDSRVRTLVARAHRRLSIVEKLKKSSP